MEKLNEVESLEIRIPGNYPYECWSLDDDDELFKLKKDSPMLFLVDIHKFKDICRGLDPEELEHFITYFFTMIDESFYDFRWDFSVNKFLGDGVLASCEHKIFDKIIQASIYLLKRYSKEMRYISKRLDGPTTLCITLDVVNCVRGGIGQNLYFDHSFWGDEVNRLFVMNKCLKEGNIYITKTLVDSLTPDQSEVLKTYTLYPTEYNYKGDIIRLYRLEVELDD